MWCRRTLSTASAMLWSTVEKTWISLHSRTTKPWSSVCRYCLFSPPSPRSPLPYPSLGKALAYNELEGAVIQPASLYTSTQISSVQLTYIPVWPQMYASMCFCVGLSVQSAGPCTSSLSSACSTASTGLWHMSFALPTMTYSCLPYLL